MSSMDDELKAFNESRCDEDEAAAKAATPGPWAIEDDEGIGYAVEQASDDHLIAETMICDGHPGQAEPDAAHIARFAPDRELRVVAVLRMLNGDLADHATALDRQVDQEFATQCRDQIADPYHGTLIRRAVASIWPAHPDYQETWKL